jgi:hypothetical protein
MKKSLIISVIFFNLLTQETEQNITLTVFVHGSLRPRVKMSDIIAISKDKNVPNTNYGKTNLYIRNHQFTRQSQAMQDLGLHEINQASNESCKLAFKIIQELDLQEDQIAFTFGWSGLLTRSGRKHEGINLYNQLSNAIAELKKQNINPKIRIIAFSHGGNVCLNMANAYQDQPNFYVDELIMVGTPVQRDTDYLVNDHIFKNIYHFYSSEDLAQKIDHLSASTHYCHQRFAPRKNFCLPSKLTQVRIRVKKASGKNNKITPFCCQPVTPSNKFQYVDPGHIELWFFGWCASGYRKDYPLYPLPVTIFTPWIARIIKQLPRISSHVTAEIYPQAGVINLDYGSFCKSCKNYCLPFINCQDLQMIKNWSLNKQPNCDMVKIYKQVIHEGLLQGYLKRNRKNQRFSVFEDNLFN